MSVGAVNKQTGDRIPTAGMPAIDNALDLTSVNPVQNAIITAALAGKQNTLTFDDVPTDNSNNPVKSNGIYDALATKQDATDNNLQTTDKTVVGAVNELKSGLTNLDNEVNGDSTTYPYADVITIENAVPANLADCSVKVEPVQDLHGYDHPWVGGAGKNLLPLVLDDIKSLNTSGTWSGNAYTINGVTYTVNTNSTGAVTGIATSGTSNARSDFAVYRTTADFNKYNGCILTGCPADGDGSTFRMVFSSSNSAQLFYDTGRGVSLTGITETSGVCAITTYGTGLDMSGKVFYPMIRLSTETDATFAPYTNYCPISGHTEASVQRTGKNLFDKSDTSLIKDGYINQQTNKFYYDANVKSIAFPCLPNTIYTVSKISDLRFRIGYAKDTVVGDCDLFNVQVNETAAHMTIETGVDAEYLVIMIYSESNHTNSYSDILNSIQIEYGSTATTFEPYAGQTYTIALGDTIYGGTVDFDSGVMTVTHSKKVLTGEENFTLAAAGGVNPRRFSRTLSAMSWEEYKVHSGGISNMFVFSDTPSSDEQFGAFRLGTYLIFPDAGERFADATEFNTWLATQYANNTPVEICYELATPLTVQLTPQQIQLLKGTNTLTASTGDISVTVNGVSGSIGSVQEQVNNTDATLAEKLPTAPTTDGAYVLTVTVASGTPTYSWVSAT